MGAYKNVLANYHLVNAGSMAASITSDALNVTNLDNVGLTLSWSGTPTGTFSVEVSNDGLWAGLTYSGSIWTALTFTPSLDAPAGSAASTYIDINQLSATALRVKYTRSGSTGTLDVYASGKSV